ncbi:NDR1/HIN1-like protein 26 isoform X2 [Benincasa hispida]|uniref:NDR1/HIN1-like protein 26 isoform X2 n=1 Tax=Benincasa hispida TaxID=102211 RepID=UPI0019000C2A|nr:NDR1/HIN1-like protein 26 isoform X2 [Benincasa hispida]
MRGNIEASKQRSNEKHGTTKRTRIIRIIGRSLLSVIILIGLAIITCWIVVFPKTPRFLVETGQVIAISSTRTMLNATIAYTVKSYNPNKRASIHMDSMRMIVTNMGQTFSSDIPTFTQKPGNLTVLSSAVQVIVSRDGCRNLDCWRSIVIVFGF